MSIRNEPQRPLTSAHGQPLPTGADAGRGR